MNMLYSLSEINVLFFMTVSLKIKGNKLYFRCIMRNKHCNRAEDFELNDDIVAEENVMICKVYPRYLWKQSLLFNARGY